MCFQTLCAFLVRNPWVWKTYFFWLVSSRSSLQSRPGWGTYLLPQVGRVVHYRWRAANNSWCYPKILPLSTTSPNLLSKYLLIMELRFHAILVTKILLWTVVDYIKCLRGPQVPYPWPRLTSFNIWLKGVVLVLTKIIYCNTHNNQYWESFRALKILSAGHMRPADLQLDHAAAEEWARRIEVNDDKHSLFMGVENCFTVDMYNMWNQTPESIFQIPRGQWGTQQICNGSVVR